MGWAHHPEVPAIGGRELGFVQARDDRQHRRGDDARPVDVGHQHRTRFVMLVVGINGRDQRSGIEDRRDGSDSYSSWLARRDRSPRPDQTFPIVVGPRRPLLRSEITLKRIAEQLGD